MKRKILCLLVVISVLASMVVAVPANAATNGWNLPANSDEMREMVVEHALAMSQIPWICTETVDFTKACWWSPNLIYRSGSVYRGIPYTSDTTAGNADILEFTAQLNANGEYVGPKTWNDMPGSDCGGQVRLAYAWAGALCNLELEELVFDPGPESQAFGLQPLGGYDYSGYTRTSSTNKTIMIPNGEQKMYDCFAKVKPGDCFYVIYPDGGEHIILAIEEARVSGASGSINGSASSVRILEQTSSIHEKGSYKSNWNTMDMSFKQLFDTGFIPLTIDSFNKPVETPTFQAEGLYISNQGQMGFHNLMSGRVLSNYNIFNLEATVTDASGKVVADGISYPNSLRADLGELDYGQELLSLPTGNYHFKLIARIGFGEVTVVDTDISYTATEGAPVVYISNNGMGTGATPATAIGNARGYYDISMSSYRNSAFYRAVTMLSKTGGTIVICDDVTLVSGRALPRYSANVSDFGAPEVVSDQTITLTSVYDGVDYRKTKGAELIMQRSADQATDLQLNIASIWKDMDFRVDYNFTILPAMTMSAIGSYVCFGGQKTVIEDSVVCRVSLCDQIQDPEKSTKYYPRIYGGYYQMATIANPDLTIMGGTWNSIIGGNHLGNMVGGTKIVFGGQATAYDGLTGGSSGNDGTIYGSIDVQITGGRMGGKIVAGSSSAFGVPYSINMKISGFPDLSKARIINAGSDGTADAVVLDMGEFLYGGEHFTAYYNEADFTSIVPAPAPQEMPKEMEVKDPPPLVEPSGNGGIAADGMTLYIIIGAAVAVVLVVVVIVIVAAGKKKKKAASEIAE